LVGVGEERSVLPDGEGEELTGGGLFIVVGGIGEICDEQALNVEIMMIIAKKREPKIIVRLNSFTDSISPFQKDVR
jgi:hypothetical protein